MQGQVRRLVAEPGSSSHSCPLPSFTDRAQSPGSLPTGGSHLWHSWPMPALAGRDSTSGLGGDQPAGTRRRTALPTLAACCSPTPRVTVEGGKQSVPGWPLVPLAGVLPHQRLPARVDSERGSGNQSDHFAHFPSLLGRWAATSQGGVSAARRSLRCPCDEWICPEGERQKDSPARMLRAFWPLPAGSPHHKIPWLEAPFLGHITSHPQA